MEGCVIERWIGREDELVDQRATVLAEVFAAMGRGDADEGMMLYGPAAGVVSDVLPAGEIVRRISGSAEQTLKENVVALLHPDG